MIKKSWHLQRLKKFRIYLEVIRRIKSDLKEEGSILRKMSLKCFYRNKTICWDTSINCYRNMMQTQNKLETLWLNGCKTSKMQLRWNSGKSYGEKTQNVFQPNKMDKSYNNDCWTYLNKGAFYYLWWWLLKKKHTHTRTQPEVLEETTLFEMKPQMLYYV